jgi:hypothetical protein
MLTEAEIKLTIEELDESSKDWVEGHYDAIVNLFRAQIKGLKFAIGEDYAIRTGTSTKVSGIKTEADIRARISELEKDAAEWVDSESTTRLIRSQIKGLKLALNEPYSIAEGK